MCDAWLRLPQGLGVNLCDFFCPGRAGYERFSLAADGGGRDRLARRDGGDWRADQATLMKGSRQV